MNVAASPATAEVAAVHISVNVSSRMSRPTGGPASRCSRAPSCSGVRACRSAWATGPSTGSARTARSTAMAAACVSGRSTSGVSMKAHACRGVGRARSAMSGSSASDRRIVVSVATVTLATKSPGTGSGGTSVPAASSAVRAAYSDSPAALGVCSRSV